jgi:hypothetical protein
MKDWNEVAAFALTLAGTEASTSYGQPAIKVNGKLIVSRSREPDSFHVVSTPGEKALLIETDPATFWQTPHYEGWAGLLVRFGSADPERVRRVIDRAWWDRLKVRQRAVAGERP